MSNSHLPCASCGSSDALTEYPDGTFCFSCRKLNPKEEPKVDLAPAKEIHAPIRGLSMETVKHYDIRTRLNKANEIIGIVLPYNNDKGRQIRTQDKKSFPCEGEMKGPKLFGVDKFQAGQAKCITITEGGLDAAAVFDMLGGRYPAVGCFSASSATADCKFHHSFINSFDKIYLCFDNDDPGERAATQVAQLFDVNKVYHVKLTKHKDANDYLMAGHIKEFTSAWWNAKRYQPKGIISSYADIDKVLDSDPAESIATYPFPTLNKMTYGIRSGEMLLFKAQEKVGKTEVMRAIEHHLLKETDYNIAIVHLEEKEDRTVKGLVGYELGKPCHLPDSDITKDELKSTYRSLTGRDDRVNIYTHFGSDDPDSILDMIRYMVAVNGCKFVFLDHITMLVTGIEAEDERRKLDYISTRLAVLTRELNFTLFLVSHVNEQGTTRGSKNISKVSDLIVHLTRDIDADDPDVRNQIRIVVNGNRFSGSSGPAGFLSFNPVTFKLSEELESTIKGF